MHGMRAEVHLLPAFYASPSGLVAQRRLAECLASRWPALPGRAVLGIGWTAPYLPLWRERAARCVALVPAELGPAALPLAPAGSVAVAEDEALPFPDRSFNNVLLVHGLEVAGDTRRLLREVWRVLADNGRVLVVAPNRLGWWAYREHTPFGHGQPYSAGQLSRLLERHMFRVEHREGALFVPPFPWAPLLKGAGAWEAVGRALAPRLAGVVVVEAVKEVVGVLPVEAALRVPAPLRAA